MEVGSVKVIIIGGVAAGMRAASKIRRLKYDTTVVVYEKGGDISYGACGLPYYISNVIKKDNNLKARKKSDFEKVGIDIHIYHEVIEVNEKSKSR